MNVVTAINVSGRFHVLDQPYAAPSKCAFCSLGHSQDGTVQFIDTTLDLDYYGVVYICSNCLTEISRSLGYIPPAMWEEIVKSSTDTLIENERLQAENDGLRSAVNILTGHRCVDTKPPLRVVTVKPEDAESSDGIAEGIESGKSESSSPSSEQGLSDVRGTSKSGKSDDKPVRSPKPVDLEL